MRKMASDALKQLIQENSAEAAHVDFKQEWHRNKAKLIHDILCLSNADYAGDRVLTRGMRVDSTISSPNPDSEQSYLCGPVFSRCMVGLFRARVNRSS